MKKNMKLLVIIMVLFSAVGLLTTACKKNTDVDVQSSSGKENDSSKDKNKNDKSDEQDDKEDDSSAQKENSKKPSSSLDTGFEEYDSTVSADTEEEEDWMEESPKPTVKVDVDFNKLTYAAFGDSITFGADYSKSYAQMAEPYPQLVGKELKLAGVKNLGISGATFCQNNLDLACMTDKILSYNQETDIISVLLGVNDFNRSFPLGEMGDKTTETIYGSLYLIAEHLTTTHKDAFVFFMTPYKERRAWSDNKDYKLTDVVKAIKVVGAKYDIPVLDLHNKGQFEDVEMYNSDNDGLHPSQEFMRNYAAPQIAQFIRDYYQ